MEHVSIPVIARVDIIDRYKAKRKVEVPAPLETIKKRKLKGDANRSVIEERPQLFCAAGDRLTLISDINFVSPAHDGRLIVIVERKDGQRYLVSYSDLREV